MKKIKKISDLENLNNGEFIEVEMQDRKRGIHSWSPGIFLNKVGDNEFEIITTIESKIGIVRYNYNEKNQNFESGVIELIETDSDKYKEYYAKLAEMGSELYKEFFARLKNFREES